VRGSVFFAFLFLFFLFGLSVAMWLVYPCHLRPATLSVIDPRSFYGLSLECGPWLTSFWRRTQFFADFFSDCAALCRAVFPIVCFSRRDPPPISRRSFASFFLFYGFLFFCAPNRSRQRVCPSQTVNSGFVLASFFF